MSPGSPKAEPSLLRAGLIPASLVTVFLLIYVGHTAFLTAAVCSLPFLLLFIVAPLLARRSEAAFDRDVVTLLATGRPEAVPARMKRAVWMRLFAPPARIAERQGMIASELGQRAEALSAYRRATEGYDEGRGAPMSVRLGYAHACLAAEEDEEAARSYRELLDEGDHLPRVHRNLAHALLRSGQDFDAAQRHLSLAEGEANNDTEREELSLLLALHAARTGDRARAKKLLRAAVAVESDDADSLRELVQTLLKKQG